MCVDHSGDNREYRCAVPAQVERVAEAVTTDQVEAEPERKMVHLEFKPD